MSTDHAPINEEKARAAADVALNFEGPDAVEVLIAGSNTGLTRYANSQIIQNTVREEVRAYVRAVSRDRTAMATTNQLDASSMSEAAEQAYEAARASAPDPEFPGLAHPEDVGRAEACDHWDESTAEASPAQRAAAVGRILAVTGDLEAAGIFETSAHTYGVFTSTGIACFDGYTRCVTTCLSDNGDATGWGESSSHSVSDVKVEAVARKSREKAELGKGATDAEPGTYQVVLEPSAVATMIEYLSYAGFGAKQVIEGESFLAHRGGQSVAAPSVTVADDVWQTPSVGLGFDFEGVPKKRVAVIDGGRAADPVTDLRTARKLGGNSTGHYSGSSEFGPYAANVILEAGDASLESLIGGISSGLLVTRFHYVNILDRPSTLLTGMTRDGTFRVEDGEIVGAVHNFRFTQSVLEALASVEAIGRDLEAFAPEFGAFGSTVAPALRLGEFRFTSTTSH